MAKKMYKENEYVVYKKDVCRIKEIRTNKMNGKDYYILVPIDDESLVIDVPTDNRMGYLRNIISEDEAYQLINNIPNIQSLHDINDKYIERTYKDLLQQGMHEDLVRIIKTTYLRNDFRKKNNKKVSEIDNHYFKQAEKYLYNELAVSLNMSFEEVKKYIIDKVEMLMK